MWCIPKLTDEYIELMEDILDLYEKPYNPQEPVICCDEKSIQLLEDTREGTPTTETSARKVDYEYKRNGTRNIFVSVEPKRGKRRTKVTKRRTKKDFAYAIKQLILQEYPHATTIHLVMDNLNTHFQKSLMATFGKEEADILWGKLTGHYTPKHASWLNMAEIEIGILSRQALKKRIGDEVTLKSEIRAWQIKRNREKKTITWKFTKEDARKALKYVPTELN